MSVLAQPSDLTTAYDWRRISTQINDDGTAAQNIGQVQANANVIALGLQASAEIIVAATVGARYQEADLVNMALSQSGGGPWLVRMCCDIWFGMILQRRGLAASEMEKLAPAYGPALARVEQLRNGERIIPGIPGTPEAGLPAVVATNNTLGLYGGGTIVQGALRVWGIGPESTPWGPYGPGPFPGCYGS
jgi:hypothetical protein